MSGQSEDVRKEGRISEGPEKGGLQKSPIHSSQAVRGLQLVQMVELLYEM